ncbi:MAG: DegV family protein [Acidimicrobiales bacterium]
MARVRVISDSSCDLPEELVRRFDIEIVSLSIRFGDEEFTDRVDLSPSEFWARCKASKTLPATAAPSPGSFQSAYERARDSGFDGVIALTISAALSATHQAAVIAADAVADTMPVRVIDSKAASMALGLLVLDVAELAQGGAPLDELAAHAEALLDKIGVIAMLDTLDHLVKGGRIGGARALLGQVLAIKPLIELKNGVVAEAGRQRTRAKALSAIVAVARTHTPLRRLAIVHGDSSERAALETLVGDIPIEFPLIIADMGPTVGTHGGPGIIGVAWLEA